MRRGFELFLGLLDAAEGIVKDGGFDTFQVLASQFHHLQAVADHHQVVAGAHGLLDGLFKGHLVQDGAHVEIVGHGQAFKAQLVAQQLGHDVV